MAAVERDVGVLEERQLNRDEALRDLRAEVRRIPRRISRAVRRDVEAALERCRALQDAKHEPKAPPGAHAVAAPWPPIDWPTLQKVLVGLLALGAVVGGFWQALRSPAAGPVAHPPAISAPANAGPVE